MSIVVRKSLGRQLLSLRQAASMSPSQVASTTVASTSKLSRIERGEVSVKLETVWALCDLYRATSEVKSRLSSMALNTSDSGWWEEHPVTLPPRFESYVELESAADRLLAWDGELVHGLLQTPAYHEAIFEVDPYPSSSAEDRDQQVRFRAERQRAAFERRTPLQISVVLGEGALLRQVGRVQVMAQQTEHLRALGRQKHVDLRVLRWSAGAHPAMKGAFNVLEFASVDAPDVVYTESQGPGKVLFHEVRTSLSARCRSAA